MTTRKPSDPKHHQLPGEADIARTYRATGKDEPPASLDAKILAQAQRAVTKPKAHGPFAGRWALPLSTAAMVVLSVGVVLLLNERGALDQQDDRAPLISREAPAHDLARQAPKSPPASARSTTPAPAKAKSALPESTQGVAIAPTAPPENKASGMAAPATAPLLRERRIDESLGATRDEVRVQNKLAKQENSGMRATADVISVQASGPAGAYQFSVGIRSADKGCVQYADWWEVVSTDGKLLYRRVLQHSHVDEQPFTRAGGPVPIQPDTIVWVRAHMNSGGYGTAFKGSVKIGFKQTTLDAEFAAGLTKQAPLPDGCDF
ncbi:MAG: hypothetical protein HY081_05805 [Gammaproteobacteria bacterium]|nr:hypothetical protein [Gammaproteobacteria bacterium]